MKKSFSTLVLLSAMFIVACGPSAEEKAKKDKEIADSIANLEALQMELVAQKAQAIQDSIQALEKAKADSLAADSMAKAAVKK